MTELCVPFLGPNDSEAILVQWLVKDHSSVTRGQTVVLIETTKNVIELSSDHDGFLHFYVAVGSRIMPGEAIGSITATEHVEPLPERKSGQRGKDTGQRTTTQKAGILIKKHGVDLVALAQFAPSGDINEELVQRYLDQGKNAKVRMGMVDLQRIGIIGGVSGGGALLIADSLLASKTQRAVAIFDQDSSKHGSNVLGVTVAGTMETMREWLARRQLDAVVIAFNRNLDDRKKAYADLANAGVPFANVIDATCEIRSQVRIGTGNAILGRAYIGACTSIGDNNFISANVCLEHGNTVGSHCAFGPGVFTSGNVTIGDKIRFATGIFIEPSLTIGSNATLSSGSIITTHVPEGCVIKNHRRQ